MSQVCKCCNEMDKLHWWEKVSSAYSKTMENLTVGLSERLNKDLFAFSPEQIKENKQLEETYAQRKNLIKIYTEFIKKAKETNSLPNDFGDHPEQMRKMAKVLSDKNKIKSFVGNFETGTVNEKNGCLID